MKTRRVEHPPVPAASQRVTVVAAGYSIHDANDAVVGFAEHFDEALREAKKIDGARRVRRVSDGVVCSEMPGRNGMPAPSKVGEAPS